MNHAHFDHKVAKALHNIERGTTPENEVYDLLLEMDDIDNEIDMFMEQPEWMVHIPTNDYRDCVWMHITNSIEEARKEVQA